MDLRLSKVMHPTLVFISSIYILSSLYVLGRPFAFPEASSALGLFFNFLPPSKAVTALCSLPSESSFLTA
jgi:hypothetical protein